jgi:hypothetical protein
MTVTFETDKQRECYQMVEDYLLVLEVEFVRSDDEPFFVVPFSDAAAVLVSIQAWEPDDAQVQVVSAVVNDPPLDERLMRHLLERNTEPVIGCFCVEDGNVLVRHGMGGSDLDPSELRDAIYLLSALADKVGKEVAERFGGKLAG